VATNISRDELGRREQTPWTDRSLRMNVSAQLRRLARREHLLAACLLGLGVLVFMWPALIEGRLFASNGALYLLAPWREYAPANLEAISNPLLRDIPTTYYPWDVFDRQSLLHGVIPTWNPLVLAGTPYFSNPQNGTQTLLNLPLWLLPLNYALGLVAAAKLWIAALGAYLLARELELDFWPGVLAGVCFALCGFMTVWLTYQGVTAVAVWLPWLILLVERYLRRRRAGDLLALTIVVALAVDGGHPGTEVHVLAATGIYALLRSATIPGVLARVRASRLGWTLAAIALGALLLSVVTIPAIVAGGGSSGQLLREGGGPILPLSALKTILFPDWWGRTLGGPLNYVERTTFAGTVALLLAVTALSLAGDWRRKGPIAALGVLGLAVPYGAPVLHALVTGLPLFDVVQDDRMILLFMFAVSMLAAFGLQALVDDRAEAWRWCRWTIVLAAAVATTALLVIQPGLGDLSTALGELLGGPQERTAVVWETGGPLWLLLMAGGLALLLYARSKAGWHLSPSVLAMLITALAAVDMYHFAHGFQPAGPASQENPPSTPAIRFLQAHRADGRVTGLDEALPADWTMNYGLRDVRGYDPPQPSSRYFRLWKLANPTQSIGPLYLLHLDPRGLRIMSLLGARYVIADPDDLHALQHVRLRTVYSGSDAIVYENTGAVPAALVPSRVLTVAGERASESAILAPGFDPRRDAVVEHNGSAAPPAVAAQGSAAVTSEVNGTVTMTATLRRGGLVMLDDAWAPGWSVSVDGRPGKVLRVDDVMRGVIVPAGDHQILWSYRTPGIRLGLLVSIASLIVLLGGVVYSLRRRGSATGPHVALPALPGAL
jgi:hypothetical protein